jgi:hypothetical protein
MSLAPRWWQPVKIFTKYMTRPLSELPAVRYVGSDAKKQKQKTFATKLLITVAGASLFGKFIPTS